MSDYDDLRRGSYHADALLKAAQQEMAEAGGAGFEDEDLPLSRASYHVDAAAKAAEQEAAEREQEAAHRYETRAQQPRARRSVRVERVPVTSAPTDGHDYSDHTVVRRTSAQEGQAASGGAVVSRRSGLLAGLRRRVRENNTSERRQERAWVREERRVARAQRRAERGGGGAKRLLAGILAVLVGLYLVVCLPIDRTIAFSRDAGAGLSRELSWHVPGMPYYLLALGSDAREGEEVSRTDTMILVRVDPLGGKLTMLSIPRDTKVQIEGYGTQKINAAYAFGGAAGAVRAVHELTGAPISHVAVINFEGVEALVDYLGGVTVDVPVAVNDPYYTGLVLPAGEQQMDGHTALLFSRVRHGFDLGDYQRQKDQRILIEAIMRKVLSLSPTALPGVVGNMGGMVSTSMRMYSILPLMLRLKLAGGATIYQATVPSTTAMEDGVSYVIADEPALAQMMDVIGSGGDPAELA